MREWLDIFEGEFAREMKVLDFKIPKTEGESFRVQVDHSAHFYDTLHSHPEIQVTLLVESSGTLVCSDYVGNFNSGDLFVIGANQPHVLRNNKEFYDPGCTEQAHAISLFFEENSLGNGFFSLPETRMLDAFLARSRSGLLFGATTCKRVAPMMHAIQAQSGIDRLLTMLHILRELAEAPDAQSMASSLETQTIDAREGERMNRIIQLAMNEYHREISLQEVADLAWMTPNAFCRYFKQKTRKTFVTFLHEIRVANACKLLRDREQSMAQIAFQSGFNSLSNFNRQFKKVKGCVPREYRKQFEH